jgi:hypothetical protein
MNRKCALAETFAILKIIVEWQNNSYLIAMIRGRGEVVFRYKCSLLNPNCQSMPSYLMLGLTA